MDAHFAAGESRLKAVRKKCGLTQDALAKASGVPVNTIRAYERKSKDLNKAKADIIIRLTRALRCEISDLLGELIQGKYPTGTAIAVPVGYFPCISSPSRSLISHRNALVRRMMMSALALFKSLLLRS